MNDDYLWDKTGAPDPDVERLERLLGGLAHNKPMRPAATTRLIRPWPVGLAAAAVIALTAGLAWWQESTQRAGWDYKLSVQGVVADARTLRVGDWLHTGANELAKLEVASIGHVDVSGNTRLRITNTGQREHRLELERGKIHAFITAPPRLFFVNTPSAVAADLGCSYDLHVDDNGDGFLEVTLGWVELALAGRRSIVPSGAQCETRKHVGPGTPHYASATAAFRAALSRIDFGAAQAGDLDVLLRDARARDTLTLWNLLFRLTPDERGRVFDRMLDFGSPPEGVSRDAVRRGDAHALDSWKEQLNDLW